MVESRNMYFPTEGDNSSKVGALVPEVELFNHNNDPQCEVELIQGAYRVTTYQQIE